MPSARYLKSKGQVSKAEPVECLRHPNAVPHILVPRCQAATKSGEQCQNPSTRWEFCFQHRMAKEEGR